MSTIKRNNLEPINLATTYFDRILSFRARNYLAYFFGTVAFILLIVSVLFKLSTVGLSTLMSSVVSLSLSFFSLLLGIDLTNTEIIKIQIIPYSDLLNINLMGGMHFWNGIMLLALMLYIVIKLFGLYIRSLENSNIASLENNEGTKISFHVSKILALQEHGDLVKSFCVSTFGFEVLKRLGLTSEQVSIFLENRREIKNYSTVDCSGINTLENLASIVSSDSTVISWFNSSKINVPDFILSASFTQSKIDYQIISSRYYGKEALSKWFRFGEKFFIHGGSTLEMYTKDIESFDCFCSNKLISPHLDRIEKEVLSKSSSNVFIVSENLSLVLFSLKKIKAKIRNLLSNNKYFDKRILLFNFESFTKEVYSSETFEKELKLLFEDATLSSNIILVIPSYAELALMGYKYGLDIEILLNEYLYDSSLKLIFISSEKEFSELDDRQRLILDKFSQLHLISDDISSHIKSLLPYILSIEKENKVLFTIQAIELIIKNVNKRNSSNLDKTPDKNIFLNVIDFAFNNNLSVITEGDVDKFLSSSLEPSLFRFSKFNSDKILQIGSNLRNSILGQEYATEKIVTCLNSVFTNRSIKNKKPVSFIFFGGESYAKLALIKSISSEFFGEGNQFIHLNMNNYREVKALSRLVGTLTGVKGVLPDALSRLRQGVVVIDEISAAHPSVQNFFAEVIHTGYMHYPYGIPIDCSSLVFVATSSLGEFEIGDCNNSDNERFSSCEESILQNIRNSGSINRALFDFFDGKVIFSVPKELDFYKIAELALINKSKEYRDSGIILVINDFIISKVLEYVVDPSFGSDQIYRIVDEIIDPIILNKVRKNIGNSSIHIEIYNSDFY